MTTKGPSCKQVIVPVNNNNVRKYMKDVSTHIININRALKSIKSNIFANFIKLDDKGIIISTNNIANSSNLQEIKRCVNNSLVVEEDQIKFPRLSQSKLYLKIVGISYIFNQTNIKLSSNEVEKILKNSHIFNNVVLPLSLESSRFHLNQTCPLFGLTYGIHKVVQRLKTSSIGDST